MRARFVVGFLFLVNLGWWLFSTRGECEPRKPLVLVVSDANPVYANAQGTGILDRLAGALFRRLDYPIQVRRLPSERALMLADQGDVDGDLFRIAGLEKRYPSLIMVPEPWLEMRFVAFTRDRDRSINHWEDLRSVRVAFIRGWQVFERHVHQADSVIRTDDAPQLFRLLGQGRVDAILYDALQGEYLRHRLGVKDARIAGLPLWESPIYPYLHRRHADLVPRVAAELRQMKQEGTWQHLMVSEQGSDP